MITKLVINVGIPCMCMSKLTGSFTRGSLQEAGILLLVPVFVILFGLLASAIVAHFIKMPRKRRGVFLTMGAFSNSIFIGLTMCVELFGESVAAYVMSYYLAHTTLFQTIGIVLIENCGEHEGHKKSIISRVVDLLKKPPLISILLSLAIIWFDIKLPVPILSYMGYMGDIVSPLGLLYTGFIIYEYGIRNVRINRDHIAVMGLRFIIGPALGMIVCSLLGVEGLARGVFIVLASLPTLTQTVVLSTMLGADEDFAAQGSAITTIACFVVVPILMLII